MDRASSCSQRRSPRRRWYGRYGDPPGWSVLPCLPRRVPGSGWCAERARTIRVLADPITGAADLAQPGSVFALRAHDAGVLARPCHVEAALELARLAGVGDAAVLCRVADDGGCPRLREFADRQGLALGERHDRPRDPRARPGRHPGKTCARAGAP
ncbi:hypothetical protein GKO32_21545 [Amycolatopsis sp. RM579]|uniref:3,4-dihydroxy-2-butanone-4-phosphate synthase n=1 Tax=Amycolatopsis pithecellobii TaxID=664692 RepID=A0A6N7YU08_9PSEU|nr:3,4-dihydroxy-2-butanone-4-phosphate synthase [Amycolatopsis pithecellobii]MTD56537.1 hypothetical protein [Amycolatopsis pithecellobii]